MAATDDSSSITSSRSTITSLPGDMPPSHQGADARLDSISDMDKTRPQNEDDLLQRKRFSEVLPLADFKNHFVAEGPLWQALVEAIAEVLDPATSQAPVRGLIVAEDPLLGLAAAQLFAAPEVGVPLERHALRSRLRLSKAVAMHGELGEFVRATRELNPGNGPLLMLGWNAQGMKLAEAALAEAERMPALTGGLVWLIKKDGVDADPSVSVWGGDEPLPVLADVASCAKEVLQHTLLRLKLPEFIDVSTLAQAQELIDTLLLADHRLGQLFDALNTPSHGGFQRLVSRLRLSERPVQSKAFNSHVLSAGEDRPRHAASLFLVSHFPDLTPEQFVELGDTLAKCADTFQVVKGWRRPPAAITDVVLRDCDISFVRLAQGQARAVLGSGLDEQDSDPLGVLAAEHMRQQFDLQAPLLKERYLRQLDGEWLLGHGSEKIAEQYRHLVVASLRAASFDDRQLPGERLRRIVYGPPWRPDQASTDVVNRRMASLARAISRTPELIEAFVGSDTDERLHEAVAELCGSRLFPSDHESQPLIRYASAGVFWLVHVHFKGRLSLDAFPSLFSQDAADDAQRRVDCLNQLRRLTPWGQRHMVGDESQSAWLFTAPQALAGLVRDIATRYWRIVGNGREWVDVALLVEAGCSYLRQALRHTTWTELSGWAGLHQPASRLLEDPDDTTAPDLALARAVFGGRFLHWLLNPALRPAESDGTDPYTAPRTARDEGRLQRRIVHTVLDALVGLGSFEGLEQAAINIWFRRALKQPRVAVYFIEFSDERTWEQLCTIPTDAQDEARALLAGALVPVLQLFPLFLLMAATRDAAPSRGTGIGFRFSSGLQQWLITQPGHDEPSPAQLLMTLVDQALDLQQQWKQSHEEVWIAEDIDWDHIAAAMNSREDALQAFAEVLAPIASDSRPAPAAGRS